MVTAEQYRMNDTIKNYVLVGGISQVQAENILKDMDYHWRVRCFFDITDHKFFKDALVSENKDSRLMWTIRKLVIMIKTDEYGRIQKWSEGFAKMLDEKW